MPEPELLIPKGIAIGLFDHSGELYLPQAVC